MGREMMRSSIIPSVSSQTTSRAVPMQGVQNNDDKKDISKPSVVTDSSLGTGLAQALHPIDKAAATTTAPVGITTLVVSV